MSQMLEEDTPSARLCAVLSAIPRGRVCSYGQVAKLADLSGPRHTCALLRKLPSDTRLPWYRVINAQGKLADFTHANIQRQRLTDEGLEFSPSGCINQAAFWCPDHAN